MAKGCEFSVCVTYEHQSFAVRQHCSTWEEAIPTRLILQWKLGPTGETVRYKARLVTQ